MPENAGFREEVAYHFDDLYKLLWSMTWDKSNTDYWLLEPGEIFAELSAELVHIVSTYGGNGKSRLEMKRILIVSLRNRATDLCVMAYGTHRQAEIGSCSLDAPDDEPDVEAYYDVDWASTSSVQTYFDLEDEIIDLSEDAKELARMALYQDDERFRYQIELAEDRKLAISTRDQWELKPTKLILRRALGWPKGRFRKAWREVSEFVGTLG